MGFPCKNKLYLALTLADITKFFDMGKHEVCPLISGSPSSKTNRQSTMLQVRIKFCVNVIQKYLFGFFMRPPDLVAGNAQGITQAERVKGPT